MEKSANGEKMLPADYDKLDYEEIKDRLCITLHSKEQRIEQLKGNLSMDIEGTDLTAAIRIFTGKKDNENGYFGIEPRYLETWGKTLEEVYQQALQNMPRLFPLRIMEMDEMIGRLIFGLDDVKVLKSNLNHTKCMFCQMIQKQTAQQQSSIRDYWRNWHQTCRAIFSSYQAVSMKHY